LNEKREVVLRETPFIQQPQFMRFGSSGYLIPHATMGTLSARDAFVGFVFRMCCSTASSIACPNSCTFVPSLALLGCWGIQYSPFADRNKLT